MKEQIAALLKHVYGYFTDEQNEGDFMKIAGALTMLVVVIRFAATGTFDTIAFGAGAGAFAVTKGLDKLGKKE